MEQSDLLRLHSFCTADPFQRNMIQSFVLAFDRKADLVSVFIVWFVSLDKKLYSTSSLSTQMYKLVPVNRETKQNTRVPMWTNFSFSAVGREETLLHVSNVILGTPVD